MKTICFDFDGVIHSYTSGWKGVDKIPDPPIEIEKMKKELLQLKCFGYRLVIFSSRCSDQNGIEAIIMWLSYWNLLDYFDDICESKPPAMVYVDDRALTFDGKWTGFAAKIHDFKTWMEREK